MISYNFNPTTCDDYTNFINLAKLSNLPNTEQFSFPFYYCEECNKIICSNCLSNHINHNDNNESKSLDEIIMTQMNILKSYNLNLDQNFNNNLIKELERIHNFYIEKYITIDTIIGKFLNLKDELKKSSVILTNKMKCFYANILKEEIDESKIILIKQFT